MVATAFVVWIHTDLPSSLTLGDTVYTALRSAIPLLIFDVCLALLISIVWMFLLRAFVKPLIYCLLILVPCLMIGLSIYPLVMSYQGSWGGKSLQDKFMRIASCIPAILALLWIWLAYRGRHALDKAMGIIQLACKILSENPTLVLLNLGILISVGLFTSTWLVMFSRLFLNGK